MNKQAVILADMLTTLLIRIDIHWDKDDFAQDLFTELEQYLDNSELHDIYSAIEKYINNHGLKARLEKLTDDHT